MELNQNRTVTKPHGFRLRLKRADSAAVYQKQKEIKRVRREKIRGKTIMVTFLGKKKTFLIFLI